MRQKVRKQIYIEPWQEDMLKRQSKELKVPEAELIRRGLDLALGRGERSGFDPRAWKDEKAFLSERAQIPPLGRERRWSRAELYEDIAPS
ncbi:MAG: ribbon-helix-helix domain-containing protein [Chloroflexi bacterium]|nr:ribbon-helix-helix domain-containing protein [Chloroflexota bacterium]